MNNLKKVTDLLSKNSPTILTSLSVAGLVTTTILAVRATPKALQIIDEECHSNSSKDYSAEPMSRRDIVKLTWKCYVPSAAMGLATIACIIGANSINLKRNAAIASAYSLAETTFKEYQHKVIETIGENKANKIHDEVANDAIQKNPGDNNIIKVTGKGDMLCYEMLSGRYFMSDVEEIRRVQNDLNQDLINDMYISLNDVYYALGLDNTKIGDVLGWSINDGQMHFRFSSQLNKYNQPCLVVDFETDPVTDFQDR